MVAQPVIEKIALPINAMFSRDELLPVFDGRLHSRLARERNNGVQMIRHQQAQATMPDESLVVEFHSGKHGIASVCAAELVFARRRAVDRDKEPTAVGHPLRNGVRQLFADGQIHARRAYRDTRTTANGKGRARSPLHATIGMRRSNRRRTKDGAHGVTRPTSVAAGLKDKRARWNALSSMR